MIGKTSFEKEMTELHCSLGVTFSWVQEKRTIEHDEKVIKPKRNKGVFFIALL
jgi:hypothetical protein